MRCPMIRSPGAWRVLSLALLVVLWCWARPAGAHQSSVVYSALRVEGRALHASLQISDGDLYEALALERDRPATTAEAEAGAARVAAYLTARLSVKNHGAPCPAEVGDHRVTPRPGGFFFVQELTFACARSIADLTLTYDLFFDVDPRHQGLARVTHNGVESEQVFRERSRTLTLTRALSAWDHARDYLELGVEHIFTGYDHLAFLFGLLILAAALGGGTPAAARPPRLPTPEGAARAGRLPEGLRHVIGVVTAFTIAHSVTLVLAALRVVALPSAPVEVAIALSIGYVAAENLWRPRPRQRFALTFAFGLVHGFGFASVLREIGLPERGLLLSLFSFNVGVELGQLLVVALTFPALRLLALSSPDDSLDDSLDGARAPGVLPPRRVLVIGALALAAIILFSRFAIPWPYLIGLAVVLPALLIPLVPRLGYDACARVGGSALLLLLSLLWTVERISGRSLLGGALG